nr:MAG TPA: hypothetical protein [Caudoviricetes sp.]
MKLSKIKSNNYNIYIEEYNSINELAQTINSRSQNPEITSVQSENGKYSFTGTNDYNEAENLLLHGWTEESEKLNEMLKLKAIKERSVKNTYDVAGFQCSVPRYLQGIPTNMINQKVVIKKQKVITITKNISYSHKVSKQKIEEESVKALQLINNLEKQGYRVILNVTLIAKKGNIILCNKVRIKNANERLNLSKVSFPMVHPSYLRRILFRWIERFEYTTRPFNDTYGIPVKCEEFNNILKNNKNDNEYFAEALYSDKDTLTLDDLIK